MKAIVTIKIDRNPRHDPFNKQTGNCPCSNTCTDMTGAHHSYLEEGTSIEDIEKKAKSKYKHITRIEVI
jgi:hypothetical protein